VQFIFKSAAKFNATNKLKRTSGIKTDKVKQWENTHMHKLLIKQQQSLQFRSASQMLQWENFSGLLEVV